MNLTKEEAQLLWFALMTTDRKEPRRDPLTGQVVEDFGVRYFPLDQQKDAGGVAKKLKKTLDKDSKFQNCEVELTTDEKKLFLGCLKREWAAFDGLNAQELTEKLQK